MNCSKQSRLRASSRRERQPPLDLDMDAQKFPAPSPVLVAAVIAFCVAIGRSCYPKRMRGVTFLKNLP